MTSKYQGARIVAKVPACDQLLPKMILNNWGPKNNIIVVGINAIISKYLVVCINNFIIVLLLFMLSDAS